MITDKNWEKNLFDIIKKHKINFLPYVPDAGHAKLILLSLSRLLKSLLISDKYLINYPQSLLEPIEEGLNQLTLAIRKMEKISVWDEAQDAGKYKANNQAKTQFGKAREKLDQGLNVLEQKAEQFLQKSQSSLEAKGTELRQKEETDLIILIIASVLYFSLVASLAFVTYKSFASPIRKLEFAAKNSIDHNEELNNLKKKNIFYLELPIKELNV